MCNEIEGSYDKIIITIVPSYTRQNITRLLPLALLLLLHAHNNTDGNYIFHDNYLHYGDTYQRVGRFSMEGWHRHAIYAIHKQKLYNFTTNTLKAYFKRPGFLFECLCDQQDSTYKWPKATRKTAKRKKWLVAKVPFFVFLLQPLCSTTISRKLFKYSLSI